MEGMQTCLHGGGEFFFPEGPETQQASLENGLIPAQHFTYRLTQQKTEPLSNVQKSPKQYLHLSFYLSS